MGATFRPLACLQEALQAHLMNNVKPQSKNVPRYTSYPTAAEFSSQVSSTDLCQWLKEFDDKNSLSIYTHIPFCDQLCWFCGCHTKVINNYRPVAQYLSYLQKEIGFISNLLDGTKVRHLHFGGGSPTMLSPEDFLDLMGVYHSHFQFEQDAEIAIEVDPRAVDMKKINAYAQSGVTRASLGLQDFDADVQRAINRVQSFEHVERVVKGFRSHWVEALNVDLVYGLPFQSLEKLGQTLEQTLSLNPDRISLFGYAYVPKMKKHQNLIPFESLPNETARAELAAFAREYFLQNDFLEIGIDHFAKATDPLAIAAQSGALMRNFQGYTTDRADALIGLGVSSISTLPQGYTQNTLDMNTYAKALDNGILPVVRGVRTTQDDHKYRNIIMNLMCFMKAEISEDDFNHAKSALRPYLELGEVRYTDGALTIDPKARHSVRLIASAFDQYLRDNETRFSQAI